LKKLVYKIAHLNFEKGSSTIVICSFGENYKKLKSIFVGDSCYMIIRATNKICNKRRSNIR